MSNPPRMTKPRIPYLTATPHGAILMGATVGLERHMALCLAAEALACAVGARAGETVWDAEATAAIGTGASLALGVFKGAIEAGDDGAPEAVIVAERGLTLAIIVKDGLLPELCGLVNADGGGPASEDWPEDDIALGVNFSHLHRAAIEVETRSRQAITRLGGAPPTSPALRSRATARLS